jgi:flagellar motor switch protein FliM
MKKQNIPHKNIDGLTITQVSDLPMIDHILRQWAIRSKTAISENLNCRIEINLNDIVKVESKEYIKLFDVNTKYISSAIYLNDINANPIYIVLEKSFLYKAIDIALGGQKLSQSTIVENRSFSMIEKALIDNIMSIIHSKLYDCVKQVDNKIKINHTKISYDSASLLIEGVIESFLGKASIKILDLVSELDIVIPYDVLLPIKTLLMRSFSNANLIQSDVWRKHVHDFMLDNELRVTVEIDIDQTLDIIKNMKIGDTFVTEKETSKPLAVKVNGIKIYACKIGKIGDKIAAELIDGDYQ